MRGMRECYANVMPFQIKNLKAIYRWPFFYKKNYV